MAAQSLCRSFILIICSLHLFFVDASSANNGNGTTVASLAADLPTDETTFEAPRAVNPRMMLTLEASRKLAFKIGVWIQHYYLPVLLVAGFVGNTLSFLVMLQRFNRKISCCVYMAALAIFDNLPMASGTWYWLRADGPFSFDQKIEEFECKALVFIGQMGMFGGTLTICVMTCDRFIAVIFPLKAKVWCTPRRARITIPIICSLAIASHVPYIWITKRLGETVCVGVFDTSIWVIIYYWFTTSISCFIPFAVLLVLNSAIIYTIRKRGKYLSKSADDATESGGQTKDTQLTIMLLLVTFAFLALQLPVYTRYMYYVVVPNNTSAKTYADYMLATHVTNKLSMTNSGINFFLYCLGGSKFRADLARLFCGSQKASTTSSGSNDTAQTENNSHM